MGQFQRCVVGLYKQKSFPTNSLCRIAGIDNDANIIHKYDDDDDDDDDGDVNFDDDYDIDGLLTLMMMQILSIMMEMLMMVI